MVFKYIVIFLFVFVFSYNVHAENKIKQNSIDKRYIILPNSTKNLICEDNTKKYSIISSDYCREIKKYFNSLTKDD